MAELELVRRMRAALFLFVALGFLSCSAFATPPLAPPPLNEQTIVGVWEGMFDNPPAQVSLLWMDINPKGKSYLVWIWPGVTGRDGKETVAYHVYELLAPDSKVAVGETRTFQQPSDGETDYFKGVPLKMPGTPMKLHFHLISPEPAIDDIWIEGVSSPLQTLGFIRCTCCLGRDIWFVKGTWTEGLGKASEHARDVIKQFAK